VIGTSVYGPPNRPRIERFATNGTYHRRNSQGTGNGKTSPRRVALSVDLPAATSGPSTRIGIGSQAEPPAAARRVQLGRLADEVRLLHRGPRRRSGRPASRFEKKKILPSGVTEGPARDGDRATTGLTFALGRQPIPSTLEKTRRPRPGPPAGQFQGTEGRRFSTRRRQPLGSSTRGTTGLQEFSSAGKTVGVDSGRGGGVETAFSSSRVPAGRSPSASRAEIWIGRHTGQRRRLTCGPNRFAFAGRSDRIPAPSRDGRNFGRPCGGDQREKKPGRFNLTRTPGSKLSGVTAPGGEYPLHVRDPTSGRPRQDRTPATRPGRKLPTTAWGEVEYIDDLGLKAERSKRPNFEYGAPTANARKPS